MKKSNKKTPLLVPTVDVIALPQDGVVNVHSVSKTARLCKMPTDADYRKNPLKARMQRAFVETGLSPEERLLSEIFGEDKKVVGLPKQLRTQRAFNDQWKLHQKASEKIEAESRVIHGNNIVKCLSDFDIRKAKRMLKSGKTYSSVARTLRTNVYSLRFCLSPDYKKPHILLLGEAQMRIAKKTNDENLMCIARENIVDGRKAMQAMRNVERETKKKRLAKITNHSK